MLVADMLTEVRRAFPAAVGKDHGIELNVVATAATVDGCSVGHGRVRVCRSGDVRVTVGDRWWMAVCASPAETRNVLWLISRGMHVVAGRTGFIDAAGHYRMA